jgi:hypothetical protein
MRIFIRERKERLRTNLDFSGADGEANSGQLITCSLIVAKGSPAMRLDPGA